MRNKILLPALVAFLIPGTAFYPFDLGSAGASSLLSTKTLVLYDAASGAIPSAPLLGFVDFPTNTALPTYVDGSTVMDTTTSGSETYAGWVATRAGTPGFPSLNRTSGFQMNFTVHVENESHARDDRAGFSIIVLSEDAKGIELAFWEDQVWAQSDEATGGLFNQGEAITFATTAGLMEYQVTIVGETYTLTASGETILTGPLRNYSAFDGFPDPYETPNFLFLGDDTTSAQARIRLSFVSVTGTESVTPAPDSTSIGANVPLPTASDAPVLSVTPIPSPTPTGTSLELCPSSWLLLTMMLIAVWMRKRIRAG